MGYRLPDERQQFRDVATKSDISVDNGTISRMSIPCNYGWLERPPRHDRMMHDHIGWPSPDHPDRSCQLPPRRYGRIIAAHPIDLPGEGYESIEVSLLDPPEGLSMSGDIDYDVVRLSIAAMCPDLEERGADVSFAVYAVGESEELGTQLRDVVTKGTLHIVAGPIG